MTEQFVTLFKSAARSLGYPDLPMVVVPHPFETLPRDAIKRLAEDKYSEIIGKLARPKEAVARA